MKKSMALALATCSSLAACTLAQSPAHDSEIVGMANPASEFCVQQGGRSEIQKDAQGNEYGVCHLPDGQIVDEWDYFRNHAPK